MRLLLGMILGSLLTIGVVFVADSMTPGDGTSMDQRRIVNWDVAGDRFNTVSAYAREEWDKLSH